MSNVFDATRRLHARSANTSRVTGPLRSTNTTATGENASPEVTIADGATGNDPR
jgi:hypothetical protein